MGKPVKYTTEELRKYIKMGLCKEAILEKMSMPEASFNDALLRLFIEDNKVYKLYSRKDKLSKLKPLRINKLNNIIIGSDVLNTTAFDDNTEFKVIIDRNKIILEANLPYTENEIRVGNVVDREM